MDRSKTERLKRDDGGARGMEDLVLAVRGRSLAGSKVAAMEGVGLMGSDKFWQKVLNLKTTPCRNSSLKRAMNLRKRWRLKLVQVGVESKNWSCTQKLGAKIKCKTRCHQRSRQQGWPVYYVVCFFNFLFFFLELPLAGCAWRFSLFQDNNFRRLWTVLASLAHSVDVAVRNLDNETPNSQHLQPCKQNLLITRVKGWFWLNWACCMVGPESSTCSVSSKRTMPSQIPFQRFQKWKKQKRWVVAIHCSTVQVVGLLVYTGTLFIYRLIFVRFYVPRELEVGNRFVRA